MDVTKIAAPPMAIAKEFERFLKGIEVHGIMGFKYTDDGIEIMSSVTHPEYPDTTTILTVQRTVSSADWGKLAAILPTEST